MVSRIWFGGLMDAVSLAGLMDVVSLTALMDAIWWHCGHSGLMVVVGSGTWHRSLGMIGHFSIIVSSGSFQRSIA